MRHQDWSCRLNAVIAKWAPRPFKWGETDCCLFAAACVEAITGTDHAAEFRDRYTSALGANRLLKRHGGLEAMIVGLGYQPCPPAYAQRGDLAAVMQGRDMLLGVCVGDGVLVQGEDGLRRWPLGDAVRAWRVV